MQVKKIIKIVASILVAVGIGVVVDNTLNGEQVDYADTKTSVLDFLTPAVDVDYFLIGGAAESSNPTAASPAVNPTTKTITVTGNELYSVQLLVRHQEAGKDIFAGTITDHEAAVDHFKTVAAKATVSVAGASIDTAHVELVQASGNSNSWEFNLKNIAVPDNQDVVVTFHKADTGLAHDAQIVLHIEHR
ncbi:MAG: hypothetical protein LBT80_09585 [Lactobacillaceae bacterium]|nr:hypothetical protein [Lactobacillaceae bacterium]